MKLTLQEAYERATKGSLRVRSKTEIVADSIGATIASCLGESEYGVFKDGKQPHANAALLAHAFNVLPEVVKALEKIVEGSVGVLYPGMPGYDLYLVAEKAIAKASTVEVPE